MLHALLANENTEQFEQEPTRQTTSIDVQTVSEEPKAAATTTMGIKRPPITPSPSTAQISTKRSKIFENFDEQPDEELPRFLSRTKDTFQETMKPLLPHGLRAHPINIEQLRKMALLKFYIAVNDLDISLWDAYLQSGTGKILPEQQQQQQQQQHAAAIAAAAAATTAAGGETISSTRTHSRFCRWPSDLKDKMIRDGLITGDSNQQRITNDAYSNYVHQQIQRLRNKNADYDNELKLEKQRLSNDLTLEMEEAINIFVEQYGTSFHRLPINGQISTIEYRYKDRLLELQFMEENPGEYPLQVFQNVSRRKYEKEIAKMHVAILKQRLLYNHLPESFESLHIPEPITLDTIHSGTMRQRLSEQYYKVLQRSKSDMLRVYIATEQVKADQYISEFDRCYEEMKEDQRTGLSHKKFTPTMRQLFQQRLTNVNQHIKYVYKINIDFFAKAPTGKN